MSLRDCTPVLRGKMVGWVGIEPTTSGLKVHPQVPVYIRNSARIPLSLWAKSPQNSGSFPGRLRDAPDSSELRCAP